jgi:hypothetical protein
VAAISAAAVSVVIMRGEVVVTGGVAAVHMVAGIAAVGTAAAGPGMEVRTGMADTPIGGGIILTVMALPTITTKASLSQLPEGRQS